MTQTSSGSNTGPLNGGATGTTVGNTVGANKGATQTIDSVSTGTTMRAVTISREYGSGGGEIAARLSKRLGWQLVDHEVVKQVAQALGVTEEEAEAHDEYAEGPVARILSSLSVIGTPIPLPTGSIPMQMNTTSQEYDVARRHVVEGALAAGRSVVVGRGSQVLLGNRRDVLHVRIVAPLEERISYVMKRESLSHAEAQSRINLKDRDRARFLSVEHHQNPADAHLYDVVINTGSISLDSAVELIAQALEAKAKLLAVPAEALGPGANIAPYPEPPADYTDPSSVPGE